MSRPRRGGAELLPKRLPRCHRQGLEARGRRAAAIDRRMAGRPARARTQTRAGPSRPAPADRPHARPLSGAVTPAPAQVALPAPPEATVALTEQPQSLVPVPPDAPQPKGQLLDFIDALKKHRPPILTPKKKNQAAAKPHASRSQHRRLRASLPLRGPRATRSSGSATGRRLNRHRRAGECPRRRPRKAPRRRGGRHACCSAPQPSAARRPGRAGSGACRRGAGAPSSSRSASLSPSPAWPLPIRRVRRARRPAAPAWSPARPPILRKRCSSSATKARSWRRPAAIRAAGSSRRAPMPRSGSGTPARARWCARSNSTKARRPRSPSATARALAGHKGGTIVLWDLERAEKLATFQLGSTAAITSLAFTAETNEFAAASQDGSVALFDTRAAVGRLPCCSTAATAPA